MPKTKELRAAQEPTSEDYTGRLCKICRYGKFLHQMAKEIGAEKLRDRHGIENVCEEYRPS